MNATQPLTGSRVFYGWWLLAGLFMVYVITNGVILNTLPIFYPALVKEFGWNQQQVTSPAQLLFLVVAILSPFAGALLDRYSARTLMLIGCVLILLAYGLYATMHSLTQLLATYLVFSVGITLAGIIPSMHIITRWFVKSRGLAVGILLVGSSLGGAIFNQVAGGAMQANGWRSAVWLLGGLSVALVIFPTLFLIKDAPAQLGLQADGGSVNAQTGGGQAPAGVSITLKQAARSLNFYILLFVTGAMWFCIVGVIQHQSLFFSDLKTDIPVKNILSLFFLSSVLGKLVFGRLSDRYPKKWIMLAAVITLALGTTILYASPSNPATLLWVYAVAFGIGFSGTFTMIQLLVAELYAGSSYGRILGIVTMVDTLAGVLGILLIGKMRTATGSYALPFLVLCGLALVAAVCIPFLKKTQNGPN